MVVEQNMALFRFLYTYTTEIAWGFKALPFLLSIVESTSLLLLLLSLVGAGTKRKGRPPFRRMGTRATPKPDQRVRHNGKGREKKKEEEEEEEGDRKRRVRERKASARSPLRRLYRSRKKKWVFLKEAATTKLYLEERFLAGASLFVPPRLHGEEGEAMRPNELSVRPRGFSTANVWQWDNATSVCWTEAR